MAEQHQEKIWKKRIQTTPHPNKKSTISNSTSISLTFNPSSEETADSINSEVSDKLDENHEKEQKRHVTSLEWNVSPLSKTKESNECNNDETLTINDNSEKNKLQKKCENMYKEIVVTENLPTIKFNLKSSNSSADEPFSVKQVNLNDCKIIKPALGELPSTSNINDNSKNESNDNSASNDENNDLVVMERKNVESSKYVDPKSALRDKLHFKRKVKAFITETHVIVVLKYPTTLYFHGKVALTVLSGAVRILGFLLKFDNKKEIEVYSIRGQSYLSIETVQYNRSDNLKDVLLQYNANSGQIKEIFYHTKYSNAVIVLSNINNDMTKYLAKHVAQHLFPLPIQCEKKMEKKLMCLFEITSDYWNVFKSSKEWVVISNIITEKVKKKNSRTLLSGGKRVGKSVLLRYLINSLMELTNVLCIDLDIGQSEFSISGCVSAIVVNEPIFGPNFTHLKKPEKSFFVGSVNVTECLDRYINAVKELLLFCKENFNNIPWIINTMGFTNSFGEDLMACIIKIFQPNLVVQIESVSGYKNYSLLNSNYVNNYNYSINLSVPENPVNYNLIVCNSIAESELKNDFLLQSRDLREMCILSYFSQILETKEEITAVTPYCANMASLKLVDLFYEGNIPATFNGNLVALCETLNNETTSTNSNFNCLGFGIVRGIDTESNEIYLLTPLPENDLQHVNTLVRGNISLPPSIYMTENHRGLVPYVTVDTQLTSKCFPKRSYTLHKR